MKPTYKRLAVVVVLLSALITSGLWLARRRSSAQGKARQVAFYQDSMHPWIKSDQPGKCTICAMDLTPIYQGDRGFSISDRTVVLNPNNITVLHVQTEELKRQPLVRTLRVAGSLEANEARKAILSAPAAGRIETLAVEFAGMKVEKGQPLITFFSPEWVQKARFYRAAARTQDASNSVARATVTSDLFTGTLVAPQSGVVLERGVSPGQYVAEAEKLLTIVDSSVLWFRFDVYERQLPWFQSGQTIEVTTPAVPGQVFLSVVSFIEPAFADSTRTVKVRAEIPNPVIMVNGQQQYLLRLGMFAEGRVRSELPSALAVQRSAILFPGRAAYVYIAKGDGAYESRRVKLGRQGDQLWEVLEGLEEGERVVIAGNVLMDAQAQFNQSADLGAASQEMAAGALENSDTPRPIHPVALDCPSEKGVLSKLPNADNQSEALSRTAPTTAGQAAHSGMGSTSVGTTTPTNVPDSLPDAPASRNRGLSRRDAVIARMALSDQMRLERRAAILAAAHTEQSKVSGPETDGQAQLFERVMAVAANISHALAADDPREFNLHVLELKSVLQELDKTPVTPRCCEELTARLGGLVQAQEAKDLVEARERFLPLSSAVVDLLRQLRKEYPAFSSFKLYHCPMAPKPGIWLQAKGPLANPFFGSKMLRCGTEATE